MKKFSVQVAEVHYQEVEIEANNKDDAINKIIEGEGVYTKSLEYNRTLDPENWQVNEITNV